MSDNTAGEGIVSSGGVHASNQPISVQQRQVIAQANTAVPDFGRAFTSLAMTPSVMGELGSKIALTAGIEIAKRQGYTLGKNPDGDVLPAITDVDKAFVDSYSTQAKATLGLQVNQMMNENEEVLNQSYKLTPDMIAEYKTQTAMGVEEILSHAPSTIKPEMENQYASAVMNSSHQLNMKMIAQQKADAKDKLDVYNNSQVKDAFNNAYIGDPAQGAQNLNDFKNDLARQRTAGIIDRKQEQSLYDSAKLNYYSGMYSKGAVDAKSGQKLPEYLRAMQSKMPNDLSPLEKITVSNNVLTYMGAVQNAEAQDNQLILSDLNRALAENTLSGSMISQAESQLPPAEFNNFMTKLWSSRNKTSTEQFAVQELASNFSNLYAMSQATPKHIDAAFNALVSKKMQENPEQDILQVQTAIVKAAGAETPGYTKQLNAMVMSGGPNEVYQASRAISAISNYAPQNIASLSPSARAISSIFEDLHEAGVDSQTAWDTARQQVLNKTEDQQVANQRSFVEYQKTHLATSAQIQSKSKSLLNVPWRASVPDMPQVSNRIMRAWEANYKLTNGNADAADKLTSQGIARAYGVTHVNGAKQKVYLPLEQTVGIGEDGVNLVHDDIVRNVAPQLLATQEAYNKGNVDYFYRIAKGEKGVEVEKVHRGTSKNSEGLVEKFNLQVTAGANLQLTNDQANPVSGAYDLGLISKDGYPMPFAQVSNTQTHYLGYRPNVQRLRFEYTKMHNSGMSQQQMQESKIEAFIEKHAAGPNWFERLQAKSAASDNAEVM